MSLASTLISLFKTKIMFLIEWNEGRKKEGGKEESHIDVMVFHLQSGKSYNSCEIHSLSVKLN